MYIKLKKKQAKKLKAILTGLLDSVDGYFYDDSAHIDFTCSMSSDFYNTLEEIVEKL